MIYEGLLLFAVVFVADYLFDTLTQSRHALFLRDARQAWLFLILGVYFVWFWTHGGQTLAMKTWRMRVVDKAGQTVGWGRASLRYLLAWFFPLAGFGLAMALGLHGWSALGPVALAFLLPPFWMKIDRDGQFLHDRLAGTRLVNS